MIVAMRNDATREDVKRVADAIAEHGLKAMPLPGGERVAIGTPPRRNGNAISQMDFSRSHLF